MTPTPYSRMSIDVSRLLHKAIKVAATHQTQTIRAYVLDAVKARLKQEHIPDFGDMENLVQKIEQEEEALWAHAA